MISMEKSCLIDEVVILLNIKPTSFINEVFRQLTFFAEICIFSKNVSCVSVEVGIIQIPLIGVY